jgi:hypothetical protein
MINAARNGSINLASIDSVAVLMGLLQGEGVQREVTAAIRGLLSDRGAESVNTMLTTAGMPSEGLFASVIGTAALIFAAVGVVVQLKAQAVPGLFGWGPSGFLVPDAG